MTDHIHLGNGTHAAYHDIDLDGSWRSAEVRSDAVVVAAQQIVQQIADVAVIVALRALPRGSSRTHGRSNKYTQRNIVMANSQLLIWT